MHLMRAGGGFGRRLVSEYDIEVARIAKQVTDERTAAGLPSVPVKLLWTREDDMAHDQYRPAAAHYFKAGLDAAGKLVAYRDFVGSTNSVVPANEFPRGFVDNVLVTAEQVKPFSVPTGALRAPPTNGVSYVIQGFIDEVAIAAGQDPIQYRMDLLNSPKGAGATGGFNPARARGVLEAVREMSGWNTRRRSLPKGTGLGAAFQYAHAGYVAYVVELTVDAKKAVSVKRAWCAVDIGRQIVNPSQSENLVHGGFIEGDEPRDELGSHDRARTGGAEQLPPVPADAHGAGACRDPGPVPRDRLRSDGPRRAVAAAGRSGDHQRHLRGERRTHPIAAAGETRLPLGVARLSVRGALPLGLPDTRSPPSRSRYAAQTRRSRAHSLPLVRST